MYRNLDIFDYGYTDFQVDLMSALHKLTTFNQISFEYSYVGDKRSCWALNFVNAVVRWRVEKPEDSKFGREDKTGGL